MILFVKNLTGMLIVKFFKINPTISDSFKILAKISNHSKIYNEVL